MHGDYRYLRKHAQVAMETGAIGTAIVIEDGDVLELDKTQARKNGKVTAGRVLIDSGSTIDVVEDLVIRDRRTLSEDGIVLAVLALNKRTGQVERAPEVVMRGFGGADITDGARDVVARSLERPEQRRACRLRHGQGESSRRTEALHPENHRPPSPGHAGGDGDLVAFAPVTIHRMARTFPVCAIAVCVMLLYGVLAVSAQAPDECPPVHDVHQFVQQWNDAVIGPGIAAMRAPCACSLRTRASPA